MASEVRLVDSNMVTAGGVTAAKRPQAFKKLAPIFLGRRTLFSKLFQLLTLRLAAVILQQLLIFTNIAFSIAVGLHLTADRSTASARFSTRGDAQSRTNSAPTGRR
ncbi:hypothetical protein KEM44_12560 (plasmid) [Sinorhizobium meliloti]|nr:hypothetical protein KEM44_12560 [Sinorhizobium meliloti]